MPRIDVRPLALAQLELPAFHPEAPGTDTVFGFLVRAGDDCILVDTGVGSGNAAIDRLYQPRRVGLPAALAGAGAKLEEVTAVVNSHLHFDHCGNNALFRGIPIYVQQEELDAARGPHYTVPEWVDFPGARYVPVRGARSISDHLELFPTPGHTPGHQSLVVRSEGRVEIVVAQAAYSAAEFGRFLEGSAGSADGLDDPVLRGFVESNATWSRDAYVASLAALRRLDPRRAFFSHDPVAWEPAG